MAVGAQDRHAAPVVSPERRDPEKRSAAGYACAFDSAVGCRRHHRPSPPKVLHGLEELAEAERLDHEGLLDQFSRNIHRGNGRAFAADPLARSLTLLALDLGWEDRYTPEQLRFLYLPLAHAEDIGMQALLVARYEALRIPEALEAAREHAEVVRLYGRFPSRNEALSRRSTPAEMSYLRETTHRW